MKLETNTSKLYTTYIIIAVHHKIDLLTRNGVHFRKHYSLSAKSNVTKSQIIITIFCPSFSSNEPVCDSHSRRVLIECPLGNAHFLF